MIHLLIKKYITNYEDTTNPSVRSQYGLLGGIVGIVCNIILFIAKITIAYLSHSVSILGDAFNNLSDAGSSIVTLIGFKVAAKPADEDHPFGHARSEYISALIIAFLIMSLGINLTISSIGKIINPETIVATSWTFIVLILSIVVKLWLYAFNRVLGNKIQSTTLKATAADSLNDVFVTTGVLIATLATRFTTLPVDGVIGLGVALFIVYAGIGIVRDTINPLLGEAPDPELVQSIRSKVLSYPKVLGIHDLVVHTYGPNRFFASVHVEVDANEPILESHECIDQIERDCLLELNIHLVIHLDPIVTDDSVTNELFKKVCSIVAGIDPVLSIHDFRVIKKSDHMHLIFDVERPLSFALSDSALATLIDTSIREEDSTLHSMITIDTHYTSNYMGKHH